MNAFLVLLATVYAQTAELDARPLPRYLDPDAILAQVQALSEAFGGCLGPEPVPTSSALLHFIVPPEGGVTAVRVEPPGMGTPAVDACLVSVARRLQPPPHDELAQSFQYTVATQGGRVLPYPTIATDRRNIPALFLFPPPSPPDVERERVVQALGFDPFPMHSR